MRKIVIAIDGYSACGKSTTAKVVAQALHYLYIDSGAMYRAVTLHFHQNYINLSNPKQVKKALEDIEIDFKLNENGLDCETYLNGLNVEKEIRKMYISRSVSEVSALAPVRQAMVAQQKKMGKKKGVVMDGRDIGTVVFPEAELKVFMAADFDVRAGRRQKELLDKGQLVDLDDIKENLAKRDHIDSTREIGPLKQAEDAHFIDTTHMMLSEQVEEVLHLATGVIINAGHQEQIEK
ncbi:MAG: (d)CMP kinase [Cyclobacteriaceae bacterium]